MPVKITNANLINKLGAIEELSLLATLHKDHGVELTLTPKSMDLTANGVPLSSVTFNTNAVLLLAEGALMDSAKAPVINKLLQLADQAASTLMATGKTVKVQPKPKASTPAEPVTQDSSKDAGLWSAPPTFNDCYSTSTHKVPLVSATKFHQPVNGTDASSRYFVVALGTKECKLNIAARLITGGGVWKLSLRVQGPDLPKHKTVLSALKFSEKSDTDTGSKYMSIHMHGPDEANPQGSSILKALGAMLYSLDLPLSLSQFNHKLINREL